VEKWSAAEMVKDEGGELGRILVKIWPKFGSSQQNQQVNDD